MSAPGPDLAADPRSWRARSKPVARRVVIADAAGVCATLEGPVHYVAGDAIITGEWGERWPVEREHFLRAYTPERETRPGETGLYVKASRDVFAVELDGHLELAVGSAGDRLVGEQGDWLIDYRNGSYGIVRADIFAYTYEVVGR